MIKLLQSLTMATMVFFGGAMLMAAATDYNMCDLEYRRVGYDMQLQCSSRECPAGGSCELVSENLAGVMVYTCLCPDGSQSECPGIAINLQGHWFAGCVQEMRPCGPVTPGTCRTVTITGSPHFYPACYCKVPYIW